MIRIDLGRGDSGKGGKPSPFSGLNLDFLKRFGGGRLNKVFGDLKGLVMIAVAVALACLPHLFFTQYRTFMIDEHEASKKKLQENIAILAQEVQKLKPFQQELESYEQQKRLVRERLEVVRALLSNRGTPVSVLDAIGQSLPKRTWLSEIDFKSGKDQPTVRLQGQSYSNEDLSDFVDKLSESVYFSEIKLDEMSAGKFAGSVDVRQFKITAKPKFRAVNRAAAQAPAAKAGATAPATTTKPGGQF